MTNFDEAAKIRITSKRGGEGEGREIVTLILASGNTETLSKEEFELLCVGYNWAMESQKAYETSAMAIHKFPNDLDLVKHHCVWASNYLGHPARIIQEYKHLIRLGIGPRVIWFLGIAEENMLLAYFTEDDQDWNWYEEMEIISEPHMKEAVKFLELAINEEPALLCERSYIETEVEWNIRFEPVLYHDEYKHLIRENG